MSLVAMAGLDAPTPIAFDPADMPPPRTPHVTQAEAETEAAPAPGPTAKEYTIDDLAAATRVPSRTIRFYQSKGVLPRPEVRGRVAVYTDAHVERLELVQELQDRGLQIKAICDVVSRLDKGELAMNEWLGLEDQLKEPWANDAPRVVDAEGLRAMVGDVRKGRIAELVRAELLERRGESFLIASPALLQIATKLEGAGVDLASAVEAGALLRRHLARAAREIVSMFVGRAEKGYTGTGDAESLGSVVREVRPAAMEALRVIFAQEIEKEIRKLVESGGVTKLTRRAKR